MRKPENNSLSIYRVAFSAIIIFLSGLSAQAQPWDGAGTESDPYLIYDANDMQAVGVDPNYWDAHFKMVNDIDLGDYTGTEFNIIGFGEYITSPNNLPFTGVFDGDNHSISNFTYVCNDTRFIGIFGYIDDPNAEIKNLSLINPYVNATGNSYYVGPIVGNLSAGTISGCSVKGGNVSGYWDVGGLVGVNREYSTVTNCYSTANVVGTYYYTGGLVGESHKGTILNCYATGSVSGETHTGGLVGVNDYLSTLSNCYATGSISGTTGVGGLAGKSYVSSTISNCYSTGYVSGSSWVGGLVGVSDIVTNNSFWDMETSGQTISDAGIGKTTEEMQTLSTFTDAGWDFVGETINGPNDIWRMCQDGIDYPRFSRQFYKYGDFVCPDGVELKDYAVLAEQWQQVGAYSTDIAPPGGDGVVDWLDLAAFVENWLTQP